MLRSYTFFNFRSGGRAALFLYYSISTGRGLWAAHEYNRAVQGEQQPLQRSQPKNRTLFGFLLLKDDIIGRESFRFGLLCWCKIYITFLHIFKYYSVPYVLHWVSITWGIFKISLLCWLRSVRNVFRPMRMFLQKERKENKAKNKSKGRYFKGIHLMWKMQHSHCIVVASKTKLIIPIWLAIADTKRTNVGIKLFMRK